MTTDQGLILVILTATVALFLWGRWRHDMVAGASLLACVFAGLVSTDVAFEGFGHPAVITVACVLILSQGLQNTGAVDAMAQKLLPSNAGPTVSIAALCALAPVLSAFMNNVGALALLMPLALQMADRQGIPPGKVLMPLSYASILGGTMTLIGTPPNLIVSGFRTEAGLGSYGMFDFTPVGIALTLAGLLFIIFAGRFLVPGRTQPDTEHFDTGAYLTEVRIDGKSKVVGKRLGEVEELLDEAEAQIIGMVRNEFRVMAPNAARVLLEGDILIVEADPDAMTSALSSLGLKLEENVPIEDNNGEEADEEQETTASPEPTRPRADANGQDSADNDSGNNDKNDDSKEPREVVIQELVVMPDSSLNGRSATDIELRTRYGINLLALSRQGHRSVRRLRTIAIQHGDVLLMQGPVEALSGFASEFRCLPLATRDIRIPNKNKALVAGVIMLAAIGVGATGLVPAAIAFATGVLAYLVLQIVPRRSVHQAVDWPVIVLLGAMLPVAGAMSSTGAADLLANLLLNGVAQGHTVVALALILIVTMTLSDFMNNAATAAVMCPIALSTSAQLGVNPDSFLMAVAIGASCAFLTPIGHQNNTLILGPGGFRFGDYWRLGLPLEMLVVAVAIPVLLVVWPL